MVRTRADDCLEEAVVDERCREDSSTYGKQVRQLTDWRDLRGEEEEDPKRSNR